MVSAAAGGATWPHDAILLLIESFRQHRHLLACSSVKKVEMWRKISNILWEKGYSFDVLACDRKMRNLKYRFVKTHLSISKSRLLILNVHFGIFTLYILSWPESLTVLHHSWLLPKFSFTSLLLTPSTSQPFNLTDVLMLTSWTVL